MPAIVQLQVFHGPTAAGADATGGTLWCRPDDADAAVAGPAGALVRLPGATTYGWVKNLRAVCLAPPAHRLDHLRVYGDGADGLGADVALLVRASSAYVDPAAQGARPLDGLADLLGYTAAQPLALAGSLAAPAIGPVGPWLQLQLAVGPAAAMGPVPAEPLVLAYDEV